ncbi:MAG: hypothetical protein IPL16_05270 [Ignavibacteria bacterium]|nr:hypothetical protein [Ignavibacteria bacterium]
MLQGQVKELMVQLIFLTIKYKQEKVLELRSLIEGFYNNVSDKMIPDSVKVYLRNSASPYSIADSSVAVTDSLGQQISFSKCSERILIT